MKKLVCSLLVIVMMLSMLPMSVSAASGTQSPYYYDVYSNDTYYAAANYLYETGVMTGLTKPTNGMKARFGATTEMTRAQAVQILWKMAGAPSASATYAFSDCKPTDWFYNAVQWAADSNITSGTNTENPPTFSPNRVVTQQEIFVFMYKFMCKYGYISDLSSYENKFNTSSLTNKASYKSWARRATGWAYSTGIFTNASLKGTEACTRANAAEYFFNLYKKYQKKYALDVVRTRDSFAEGDQAASALLFRHYNITTRLEEDLTEKNFINTAMPGAFANAKPLDICYLYFSCHGSKTGIYIFEDTGNSEILTPLELRTEINKYMGTFVVFLDACYTGTFVGKGLKDAADDEMFDAESFVSILYGEKKSGELAGVNRIKVLCSSNKEETSSAGTPSLATKYWCRGSINLLSYAPADTNKDKRISLAELYSYSYEKVLTENSKQHIVCSDTTDLYNIFIGSWN